MVANEEAVLYKGECLFAQNVMLRGGIWTGRAGIRQLGSAFPAGTVQGLKAWSTMDKVKRLSAVVGGVYYEYDFGALDFVEKQDLTLLDFDDELPVRFGVSRGRLLICQKEEDLRPYMVTRDVLDEPVFTELTEAPAGAGNVCVYYDKVFFYDIFGQPFVFEWSFEGDPEQGYFNEGFDWEFVQTDYGAINTMTPLNNRLMVQKRDSSTAVYGEVDVNFKTDAIREGISETDGSIAPMGVAVADGDVHFLSEQGPRVAKGGEVVYKTDEIERPDGNSVSRLADIWERLNDATQDRSLAVFMKKPDRRVWFALPLDDAEYPTHALVYGVDKENEGWSLLEFPFGIQAMDYDTDPETGEGVIYMLSPDGVVYHYRESHTPTDEILDGPVAIHYRVRGRNYGADSPQLLKRTVELRLTFDLDTDLEGSVYTYVNRMLKDKRPFGIQIGRAEGNVERRTYVRGMDTPGYEVAWEVDARRIEQRFNLVSGMVIQTLMGTEANWRP